MRALSIWIAATVATGCSSAPLDDPEQVTPAALALAASYNIAPVPALASAGRSYAYAINDNGIVAGAASSTADTAAPVHAIRWTPGSAPKDLGLLSGGATSSAFAINGSNVVAGNANVTTVSAHGFVYVDPGPMKDLGWLPLGGLTPAFQNISATGINDSGQIVGVSPLQLGAPSYAALTRAFLWQSGAIHDLGAINDSNSAAFAINVNGAVTGSSSTNGGTHAALWNAGTIADLGSCQGANTAKGTAINATAHVAGTCFFPQVNGYPNGHPEFRRAFFYSTEGGMLELGTLGGRKSEAFGVDANDTVVGKADVVTTSTTVVSHAFAWTASGGMKDLNGLIDQPGWVLVEARAINAKGQIAGVGTFNGTARGFVLTPK
jgi:probable HAF family extracellular repeat protein